MVNEHAASEAAPSSRPRCPRAGNQVPGQPRGADCPHQKEQALPRYQFRFGSFHKGNPHGLSATLHSPFQGKTWLIGETDEETLYSVPTVPGFGKLQPVNQIQPTTWFCSFSFMRTRPYWFLHLCSVALSHLKSRGKE